MTLFLISFCIVLFVVLGMSVGVLAGRGPIKGSCGGMSALGIDTECDICGGDPNKCENSNETSPAVNLSYDATRSQHQVPALKQAVLEQAVDLARSADIGLEKVWLFGSRARGDQRDKSDVDLAFKFDQTKLKNWTLFFVDFEDNIESLLPFDLINIDAVEDRFRDKIMEQGILLYE